MQDAIQVAAQLTIGGVTMGAIYGLVALGIVFIFRASNAVSFAQGHLVLAGAVIASVVQTQTGAPYVVLFAFTLVAGFILGVLVGEVAFRPFRANVEAVLVSTLAVALLMEAIIVELTGGRLLRLRGPFPEAGSFDVAGVNFDVEKLWVTLVVAALLIGFYLLLNKTSLGSQLRAAAANPSAAALAGVNVTYIHRVAWGLGGALATVAGFLIAPTTGVESSMAQILIRAFAGAIIGGFGSLLGAVLGGLVIGLGDSFVGYVIGGLYRDVGVFGLLMIFMVFFPRGMSRSARVRLV